METVKLKYIYQLNGIWDKATFKYKFLKVLYVLVLALLSSHNKTLAKAVLLLERPATAYTDKNDLLNSKQISAGIYEVLELYNGKDDEKPLFKIALPKDEQTTKTGYAVLDPPNRDFRQQMLVKVFLNLPVNAAQLSNYIEINGSLLKDTGKKVYLPAKLSVLTRKVTFESHDTEEAWIEADTGKIFYNISVGRVSEILRIGTKLNMTQADLIDSLQKKIKKGAFYELVLAILGYPLKITKTKNTIIWTYKTKEYHFKGGKLFLIK